MGSFIDLSEKTFGRLTVLEISHRNSSGIYWMCRCSCGKRKAILGSHLHKGAVVSCGCQRSEQMRERSKKRAAEQRGRLSYDDAIRSTFADPLALLAETARRALLVDEGDHP